MPPCKNCCGHLRTISVLETRIFHLEDRDTTLPWTPQVRNPSRAMLLLDPDISKAQGCVNATRPGTKTKKQIPQNIVIASDSADLHPEINTATGWPSLATARVTTTASIDMLSTTSPRHARTSTPRHTERTGRRVQLNSPKPLMAIKLNNRFLPLLPSEDRAPVPRSVSRGAHTPHNRRPQQGRKQIMQRPEARARVDLSERGPQQKHGKQPGSRAASKCTVLIIGHSNLKDINIRGKDTKALCFPNATVRDISKRIPEILSAHKDVIKIVIHTGENDIITEQTETLKKDFTELFELLSTKDIEIHISGPLPPIRRGPSRFSRLLCLNRWLSITCHSYKVHFIDNFNLFWKRRDLYGESGFYLNRAGERLFTDNVLYTICHPTVAFDLATVPTPSHNILITAPSAAVDDASPFLDGLVVNENRSGICKASLAGDNVDKLPTSTTTDDEHGPAVNTDVSPADDSMDAKDVFPSAVADDGPSINAKDDVFPSANDGLVMNVDDISPAPESLSEADDSPAKDDIFPSAAADSLAANVDVASPSLESLSEALICFPPQTTDVESLASMDDYQTTVTCSSIPCSPSSSGFSSPMLSPPPFTPRMMELVRTGLKCPTPKSRPASPKSRPAPQPPHSSPPQNTPTEGQKPQRPPRLFLPQSPGTDLPQSPEMSPSQVPGQDVNMLRQSQMYPSTSML